MSFLPKLDLHYALRAAATGAFLVLLVYVSERFQVTHLNAQIELAGSAFAVGAVIGFVADLLSLYKLNPLYRRIRRGFFLRLYEAYKKAPTVPGTSEAEKIRLAEQYREELIYSLKKTRNLNLRIEHAMWIALYNISMLSIVVSVVLPAGAVASPASVPKPYLGMICLLSIAVLALISAAQKNNSYNDKIIYLATQTKKITKGKQ